MRRLNKEAPCDECKIVRMLPENNVIDYIMCWYGSTFTNGMGGINSTSIKEAIESESEIIKDETLINKKLIIYMRAAIDAQNKEHIDGGKNN